MLHPDRLTFQLATKLYPTKTTFPQHNYVIISKIANPLYGKDNSTGDSNTVSFAVLEPISWMWIEIPQKGMEFCP